MRALILTSNSLRHRYFAMTIARAFDAPLALTEPKRNYYSVQRDASNFVRDHFSAISTAEKKWFAGPDADGPSLLEVDNINSPALVEWAIEERYDVVCLFGTAILKDAWLNAFPSKIVNLHLGLSPFYKGSATLFWPFANRELEYLGTTIHLATARVDAGEILARLTPDLRIHDSYYEITSRLIRDSIDKFPEVVADYLGGQIQAVPQESISGKFYRKSDFTEGALLAALAYVGDGLSETELARIEVRRKCLY